jgi:hypothetical protein
MRQALTPGAHCRIPLGVAYKTQIQRTNCEDAASEHKPEADPPEQGPLQAG